MLTYKITHYTEDDEDAETGVFYDTLISRIDEMTVLANIKGVDLAPLVRFKPVKEQERTELLHELKNKFLPVLEIPISDPKQPIEIQPFQRSRPYKRHQR